MPIYIVEFGCSMWMSHRVRKLVRGVTMVLRLTYRKEIVTVSVHRINGELGTMVFHKFEDDRCRVMQVNGFQPIGILFGFNDTKGTAAAEAVVRFENGRPVVERKGLQVQEISW